MTEKRETKTYGSQMIQRPMSDKHPEAWCERCGGKNICWFTDNDEWNRVAGDFKILCPLCFASLAYMKGDGGSASWMFYRETYQNLDASASAALLGFANRAQERLYAEQATLRAKAQLADDVAARFSFPKEEFRGDYEKNWLSRYRATSKEAEGG